MLNQSELQKSEKRVLVFDSSRIELSTVYTETSRYRIDKKSPYVTHRVITKTFYEKKVSLASKVELHLCMGSTYARVGK